MTEDRAGQQNLRARDGDPERQLQLGREDRGGGERDSRGPSLRWPEPVPRAEPPGPAALPSESRLLLPLQPGWS